MAQDKTMPPSEAPTQTTEAMPGEMATQPSMPVSGQVMVKMPSDAFDSIYTLVTQLASGLETLKADVDAQKGITATSPAMTASEAAPIADEEFLKSIAEQGSMR